MTKLSVHGLVKRFGGLLATDRVDLEVRPGEIHAVIGPNGAGKTTLINQLSGEIRPDEGRILLDGVDIIDEPVDRRVHMGIARSYQIASIFPEFSALQNVMLAVQGASGDSMAFWQAVMGDTRLTGPALRLLKQVGLDAHAHDPVTTLAHGAQRQLEIAMTLALEPKVLLLDEPMAGMSQHESRSVVDLLCSLRGRYAIVLVEHDMDAVFALADRITVLVDGRPIACGSPDQIRANADVRAAYLGENEEAI
jgi:branched-chain amino acid transport system ATP-binding protein